MSSPQPAPSSSQPTSALAGGELSSQQLILRLFKLSWRFRGQSAKVLVAQVVLLGLGVAGLALSGLAVDVVHKSLQPSVPGPRWPFGWSPPESWSSLTVLFGLAGLVLGMAATRAVINYFYSIAVGRLIHVDVVPSLRSEVYARLQRLSFRFFDAHATGTIINRVTRDVQLLRSFVDGVLITGAIMLLSLAFYLAFMLNTHVGLTLACLSLTPLLWLATRIFSRWARPAYAKNRELVDDLITTMAEGAEGAQVTKSFGRETDQHEAFVSKNRAVLYQQRWIFRNVSLYSPTVSLLSQLMVAVLLTYGGWLVTQRQLTLGALIVFAGLLQQFGAQVRSMATIVNTLQQSLSGARRVFEVLDAPIEIDSPSQPVRPERIYGSVRLDNVQFRYQAGQPALQGLNLKIEPGQMVAIVGPTGAGKSTLLSLIPRFYDPTSGHILIDGIDVRDLDVDHLRRHIGVVFQESLLFSSSIAENIAFGHPDASRERIEHAAKLAHAHDFVMELPKGYDTVLEAGATNLSGGQRQRLAIARALLLEPAIMLLDDPTAAVDPDTEHEVLQAMDSASEGRTTFVVAHRLSTLRRADLIVVLENGRITQCGTHAELIGQSGLYRLTAELQGPDAESLQLLGAGGCA